MVVVVTVVVVAIVLVVVVVVVVKVVVVVALLVLVVLAIVRFQLPLRLRQQQSLQNKCADCQLPEKQFSIMCSTLSYILQKQMLVETAVEQTVLFVGFTETQNKNVLFVGFTENEHQKTCCSSLSRKNDSADTKCGVCCGFYKQT